MHAKRKRKRICYGDSEEGMSERIKKESILKFLEHCLTKADTQAEIELINFIIDKVKVGIFDI